MARARRATRALPSTSARRPATMQPAAPLAMATNATSAASRPARGDARRGQARRRRRPPPTPTSRRAPTCGRDSRPSPAARRAPRTPGAPPARRTREVGGRSGPSRTTVTASSPPSTARAEVNDDRRAPGRAEDRRHQMRHRLAERERADQHAEGEAAPLPEPAGGDLHRRRIHPGQRRAGRQPGRDQRPRRTDGQAPRRWPRRRAGSRRRSAAAD